MAATVLGHRSFAVTERQWIAIAVATQSRRDLKLEAAISKLDKYQLLLLDDIAYVTKDQPRAVCCSS